MIAPDKASFWFSTPTPAAAESPKISNDRGLPLPTMPSLSPLASSSRGVFLRTYVPCTNSTGSNARVESFNHILLISILPDYLLKLLRLKLSNSYTHLFSQCS